MSETVSRVLRIWVGLNAMAGEAGLQEEEAGALSPQLQGLRGNLAAPLHAEGGVSNPPSPCPAASIPLQPRSKVNAPGALGVQDAEDHHQICEPNIAPLHVTHPRGVSCRAGS